MYKLFLETPLRKFAKVMKTQLSTTHVKHWCKYIKLDYKKNKERYYLVC